MRKVYESGEGLNFGENNPVSLHETTQYFLNIKRRGVALLMRFRHRQGNAPQSRLTSERFFF